MQVCCHVVVILLVIALCVPTTISCDPAGWWFCAVCAGVPAAQQQQLLAAGEAVVSHVQAHSHLMTGMKDFWVQLGGISFVPATFGGVPGSSKAATVVSLLGRKIGQPELLQLLSVCHPCLHACKATTWLFCIFCRGGWQSTRIKLLLS